MLRVPLSFTKASKNIFICHDSINTAIDAAMILPPSALHASWCCSWFECVVHVHECAVDADEGANDAVADADDVGDCW